MKLDRFRKDNGSPRKGFFDREPVFSSKRNVNTPDENREHQPATGVLPPRSPPSNVDKSGSPSIPARSPFRIRDSQVSVASLNRSGSVSKRQDVKVSDARTSLTDAVAHLWKTSGGIDIQYPQNEGANMQIVESMDDLLAQLTASQAIIDASKYNSLPLDEIEQLREVRSDWQEKKNR